MNKRRSGTCLSKCFPIIVTLFDIISHRHFCSDSDVFLHRFKYWFVFVGCVTLVNKHSQTFLPCFNIFPTALRSLYSWQFIHIYTLALRWKSAALNVSAEENGLRDATKHSFGSQQFLYVVRPSQTINFLVYFDFFMSWASLSLHTVWRGTALASPSWWLGPLLRACKTARAASGRRRCDRTGESRESSPAARWGRSNTGPAGSPSVAQKCSKSWRAWLCCPSDTWAHRNTARTGVRDTEVIQRAISQSYFFVFWHSELLLFYFTTRYLTFLNWASIAGPTSDSHCQHLKQFSNSQYFLSGTVLTSELASRVSSLWDKRLTRPVLLTLT